MEYLKGSKYPVLVFDSDDSYDTKIEKKMSLLIEEFQIMEEEDFNLKNEIIKLNTNYNYLQGIIISINEKLDKLNCKNKINLNIN